jgi:4-hydroxybenzoate polyprenyltransferase
MAEASGPPARQDNQGPSRPRGWENVRNYLKVARIDHWFKNIFVLAGVAAALLYMTTTKPEHSFAGKVHTPAEFAESLKASLPIETDQELKAAVARVTNDLAYSTKEIGPKMTTARQAEAAAEFLAKRHFDYMRDIRYPIKNRRGLDDAAAKLYIELDAQPLIWRVLRHWQVYVYGLGAVLLTCFVASFNYIINEILDARRDALHPKKRLRPIPSGLVSKRILRAVAIAFLLAGLGGSFLISRSPKLFYALGALFAMGLIYNVRPVRTKDLPYLDVITESINNPIRLLIGWYAMTAALYEIRDMPDMWPDAGFAASKSSFCPMSVLMAWWTLGAFLMTAKRFAEYRFIGSHWRAKAYRRSFHFYSEEKLLVAMIVYISLFMLSFGVMAIRYNLNLVLGVPLFIVFIVWFFHLSFQENSPVKEPEKLLRNKKFMLFCLVMFVLLIALSVLPMKNFWQWVQEMMGGDPFHPKSIAT